MKSFLVVLLILVILPRTANAVCTNPAADVGSMIYNTTEKVFQGCTQSQGWVAFHEPLPEPSGAEAPCETGPVGTRCTSDNAIYAGDIGGNRIYAAACDHGMTWNGTTCTGSQTLLRWKTTTAITAGTASMSDGVANTDAMATAGIALHPAAEACRNAGPEWYLPASDELSLLYNSLVGQGDTTPGGPLGSTFDFNTSGPSPAQVYWSSSEIYTYNAVRMDFGLPLLLYNYKTKSFAVRCVRR